jgi:branched-chain amino acid transport system substrate-binding protein
VSPADTPEDTSKTSEDAEIKQRYRRRCEWPREDGMNQRVLSKMESVFGLVAAAAILVSGEACAQYTDGVVKIGILTDMSSLYADDTGPGSVAAARLAVEDFGAAAKGMKVEIVAADHQNKADVGSSIASSWFDVDKVDVIVDVPNSGVALAVSEIAKQKNKLFLASGPATSDLTGPKCSPNTVHWTYDTWMLPMEPAGPW